MIINSILKQLKLVVKGNSFSLFPVMLLFSYVAYLPALSGEFIADDLGQIVSNRYINDLSNIPTLLKGGTFDLGYGDALQGMYYRPMMMIFYAWIAAVFGIKAYYFHLFQLFLHAVNSYLIYLLFRKLIKHPYISVFFSLIFLLHPMNSETVSYIANLQDVLMFMFGMLALLIVVYCRPSHIYNLFIFVFFLSALLGKESALMFAPLIYLFVNLFTSPAAVSKKSIYFIIVSAVAIYIYLRCGLANICLISSNAPIAKLPFAERIAHVPYVIGYYLKTFFYPADMAILQQWIIKKHDPINLTVLSVILVLFFGFIIFVPFLIYMKRNALNHAITDRWFHGQYSAGKVYVFFTMWFFTGLAMHIHIIPLDFTVADRWFYVTMIGLLGMFGSILGLFDFNRRAFLLVSVLIIGLLAWRTNIRAQNWSDPIRLYKHDIAVSPDSGPLQNNYGAELLNRGKVQEAKKHFLIAVKLQPENPIYWSNLGIVAEKEGIDNVALQYYEKSNKAGKWQYAFERRVILLVKLNKKSQAKTLVNTAMKYFPDSKIFNDIVKEYQM